MFFVVQPLADEIIVFAQNEDGIYAEKLNATDLYAMLPKRRARFLAPRAGDSMMAAILIKQAFTDCGTGPGTDFDGNWVA